MTSATNQLMTMCVNRINAAGGVGWRQNAGKIPAKYTTKSGEEHSYMVNLGRKGVADVIGLLEGVFIACEVKTGRDKMRDDQLVFLLKVIDNKGVAVVVRDEPQRLLDVVNALGQRNPPQHLAKLITRREMIKHVFEAYFHDHAVDELPGEAWRYYREIQAVAV